MAHRTRPTRNARGAPRYHRTDWLRLSLDHLARSGGAKPHIETLCRQLKVTRGSFYWHFNSRGEFVKALVDYWDLVFTREPIERHRRTPGSGEDRLFSLMELLEEGEFDRYDMAVRAWAMQERKLAARVARVDKIRLAYLRSIFAEIGFRGRELEMRTRLFVVFHSMDHAVHSDLTEAEKKSHLRRRHALLTRR